MLRSLGLKTHFWNFIKPAVPFIHLAISCGVVGCFSWRLKWQAFLCYKYVLQCEWCLLKDRDNQANFCYRECIKLRRKWYKWNLSCSVCVNVSTEKELSTRFGRRIRMIARHNSCIRKGLMDYNHSENFTPIIGWQNYRCEKAL
jgi:hypothetical protein